MNILKERLTAATEAKTNDIKTFVWKGPKEELNGQKFQDEIRLIDASDMQLCEFYKHCESMLYNQDPLNPGRITLIQMLQDDREKCNAELYLRWIENSYLHSDDRARYQRFQFLQDIKKYLGRNSATIPQSMWNDTPISAIIENVPDEFANLSINMVINGCMDYLGVIHKKPLTLNFLVKLGLWFTSDEMKNLSERDEKSGKYRSRLDVIKERLNLKNNVNLHVDPTGLSYGEFRAMVGIRSKKFSELTTDQLVVLRSKVLFRLEEECSKHADAWIERMRQLELTANSRGWSFNESAE